jgi:hypothetical protein
MEQKGRHDLSDVTPPTNTWAFQPYQAFFIKDGRDCKPGPAVLRLKSVYHDLCCAHDGSIDIVLPAEFFSGRNPGNFPPCR